MRSIEFVLGSWILKLKVKLINSQFSHSKIHLLNGPFPLFIDSDAVFRCYLTVSLHFKYNLYPNKQLNMKHFSFNLAIDYCVPYTIHTIVVECDAV